MGSYVTSQELIDLGNRIRKRRQELHLSQEVLAEKVGISPNTVSRIEGGQTAMSVRIFQNLITVLESDANQLLGHVGKLTADNRKLQEMTFRILHLRKGEQAVVEQTMKALVDGLERSR